ncbi:MAG: ammonia-forming cytochrome c nitrite reductase subunit c552 [Ignavibacteriae bacterium]|nr:MAG: ammonia-forming cytochrome c nitrite reductase subunit c552 [Ignavibacteriota bacterium]
MKKALIDYTLRIRLPIILFVGVISFIGTYFFSRAERDNVGYSPVQPISFSHKLHAGTMQIDCQYCHAGVTISPYATIPPVSTCMNCHAIARKDKPEIVRLTNYYNKGIALPWKRVHRLPDYAYFNHSVHVNKGIDCSNCHGPIEDLDGAMQVSEFTMAACLNCHRNAPELLQQSHIIKKGPENCYACHR